MRKTTNTFLILLFYTMLGFSQQNISDSNGVSPTSNQMKLLTDCMETLPNHAQVSVAIIENGMATFLGFRKDMDSILPINNSDSVFEIGSITKAFTATLLADLVIKGSLTLEDDINAHLDYDLKDNLKITFKQLVTHTSGLPRVPPALSSPSLSLANPYKDYSEKELKTYLTNFLILDTVPGAVSSYSNLGFGLLGHVLEAAADHTYEELLSAQIFSKYNMEKSTTDRAKIHDRLVTGINDRGEQVPNWDMAVHMGAGGILSTTRDLSKFALAHFDQEDKTLAMTRTKQFEVTDNYSMGMAWGLITSESGDMWTWHNGGTGGYTSSMILNTKDKSGVIILSNISALGQLTNNIMGLAPALMTSLER